ncbi:GNAT family N-acetyltransferase [Kineococcus rhizosphaerae]|uniref:RimJ/RimL family protein N-acetyltransferase n=1 Tax=Kineococcus rhizosphaerae TaxID=559628 RepID=A0A2T0R1Y7_9ACTN|nr:GNAT family N-acetyltransferase [Kineococcus rhizosphaerae]PRY13534.1 RimJ/RimL family protein N-acetyltransferase [Kineococcus rhizosphaerae]
MTGPATVGRVRELLTARLRLRAFGPGDEDAVHAYAGDPQVCTHVTWGPNSRAESEEFVAEQLAARDTADEDGRWTWAITRDGEVLGTVALWVSSAANSRGELGYVLRRDAWGAGITTEAARAVLGFGFSDAGLARVEATCRPENTGSRRVLEKIGMRCEGLLRSHVVVRGERRDSLLFAAVG